MKEYKTNEDLIRHLSSIRKAVTSSKRRTNFGIMQNSEIIKRNCTIFWI